MTEFLSGLLLLVSVLIVLLLVLTKPKGDRGDPDEG